MVLRARKLYSSPDPTAELLLLPVLAGRCGEVEGERGEDGAE